MTPPLPSPDFLERIRARLGDRYEFERELTGGGMSRVFVAREKALDRTVVVKFLPPDIAAEANRDRFRREIQMAARLSHPHIAPLFSAAEDGELLYYTMPFIAGESLRHSLEAGRRFGVHETIEILKDVAGALAYAHKAGIVHRDIKPANILREGDHAVVTDFGVAKAVSFALGLDSRSSMATTSGMAIGTPAYMAPEQIAGDVAADHRVDIYAFGLLGYELLTGHAPFRASSPQAQLAAQLTQPPEPITAIRPDVPPGLAALLERCLEKDAAHRPDSADAVLEELRSVDANSGPVQQAHVSHAGSRSKLAWAGAGALGVLALLWLAASRRSNEPAPPPALVRVDTVKTPAPPPAMGLNRAQKDSLRILSEQAAEREQRLIALLRDSISNAVHRSVADSIVHVREQELAEQRVRDSLARMSRMTFTMPPAIGMRGPISPEAFATRAQTLGAPRRVGIAIYSGVRHPQLLLAAGAVRDSIITRLRSRSRFVAIPADSVALALSHTRSLDSLRAAVNADMWVTIYAAAGPASDTVRWDVTLRDFTAHNAFSTQNASSRKVVMSSVSEPGIVSPLTDAVLRALESMDRAPRRESPTRPEIFLKPE